MPERLVYVSRLEGLPLVSPDGVEVGRLVDVVLSPPAQGEAPRVNGFVVTGQRRRLFVPPAASASSAPRARGCAMARSASTSSSCGRARSW